MQQEPEHRYFLPIFVLLSASIALGSSAHAQASGGQGVTLSGKGNVARTSLTRGQLFGHETPSQPVDDTAGFALPENAAEPSEAFEGTLTLKDLAASGKFTQLADVFEILPPGESPWKHLPAFRFQFVQSGSHLIPVQQGLAITGSRAWNYIIGPGRVWREDGDAGYTRAAFPFSLVQRNQNCVHNGEMTFLFSNKKSPKISDIYYQITQETCYPMKFDLWGVASASYEPGAVAGASEIKQAHAAELAGRMPVKPISSLAGDFPDAHFNVSAIPGAYKSPTQITTFGVVVGGVNYSAGCRTRWGEYAFCADMRLPSYSIAKSVFAGIALMQLGQLYGAGVYGKLIKDFVRPSGGRWEATTLNNASDMATGNYDSAGYEADEDGDVMTRFLVDEAYDAKVADAFGFTKNYAEPGTTWVYQSSATFLLTQAMNIFLQQQRGGSADIFNLVRDDVYKPLGFSAGGLTTIRTGNSPTGAPSGYYGLFFNQDDVAKIGNFLNHGGGKINGTQVLEPTRLKESLFRSPDPFTAGVPILGSNPTSALGFRITGSKTGQGEGRRYAHGFWGRHISVREFPQYSCDFWLSLMSGYGGNIVAFLPNGATFYIFSDGMEFPWANAVSEVAKLAPTCR